MNKELIEQLKLVMSSDWLNEILKDSGHKSGMTSNVSQIIGEVYIYAFSTQSCDGIKEYINILLENFKTIKKPSERDEIRANMLLESLAKQEGISIDEIGSNKLLRTRFLENYFVLQSLFTIFLKKMLKYSTESVTMRCPRIKATEYGISNSQI